MRTTNKKIIEKSVADLVRPIINEKLNLNLELWNVEFYLDSGEFILDVIIDKKIDANNKCEEYISLEDCEKVTRAIEPCIDDLDPIEQSYSLVVSSPGIERELKTEAHILKYIELAKPVNINMFAKKEIKIGEESITIEKKFEAVILNYDTKEDMLKLKLNNNENIINIHKKDIAHIYAQN